MPVFPQLRQKPKDKEEVPSHPSSNEREHPLHQYLKSLRVPAGVDATGTVVYEEIGKEKPRRPSKP